MIVQGRANVIIDGQWGSSGKGLLAAYLYERYPGIDLCVCDFMPNAGHTFYTPGGLKIVSRLIPAGAFYGRKALIGPHASLDMGVFMKEYELLRQVAPDAEVLIHPLACIVTSADTDWETATLGRIASTVKGGHRAQALKTARVVEAHLAEDEKAFHDLPGVRVHDTQSYLQRALKGGATALVETAQGFDLGLNHGHYWPYVTGRDCLIGRALDNAGCPVSLVGSIIGAIRFLPIRVGNTNEGNSGPFYSDQRELTWDEVSSTWAGKRVCEMTTVTGRVRRIFTFSEQQLDRFLQYVRPGHMFLNFWNYSFGLPSAERDVVLQRLRRLCWEQGCDLHLLGTGPHTSEVIDLHVVPRNHQ